MISLALLVLGKTVDGIPGGRRRDYCGEKIKLRDWGRDFLRGSGMAFWVGEGGGNPEWRELEVMGKKRE